MLQKLHIQNYAIIDEISIDFSSRLNIITGETGAGKSILVGALSLVLGERADTAVLSSKDKKCVVEAFFGSIKGKEIKAFFTANDLEADSDVIVRREIAANGKSRAFINDTPVNLNQLKELSSMLVDLHQQFDTVELGDNDFQREVLDALAGNGELLQEYSSIFSKYSKTKKELESLQLEQSNANKELDYNKFQFDELEEAGLKENELEELDAELKLLSNAESVKQDLGSIYGELKETEQPIVQQLKVLSNKLRTLEQYHTDLPELSKRLLSSQVELQDIADELERINDTVQYSPDRIQIVNDKMAVGYKLLKKHGVLTTNELLGIKDSLQEKLTAIFNITETIAKKEKDVAQLLQQAEKLAATISTNRKKATEPFAKQVNVLLAQVGMPNAQIKIQVTVSTLNIYGADTIEFLFDANKSNRFEPLRKVASGGELSRLMLCIKSLVAKKLQLPTLIFDEIDSGISGEAAKQVGLIMKELSASHQLISITHQPQIAAKADAHYFVYKEIKGDKIATSIRQLSGDERITAIAHMLSGEKPTAAALANAREMVGN
jgi:DNA repair protein RecN (Recombination protein N)